MLEEESPLISNLKEATPGSLEEYVFDQYVSDNPSNKLDIDEPTGAAASTIVPLK